MCSLSSPGFLRCQMRLSTSLPGRQNVLQRRSSTSVDSSAKVHLLAERFQIVPTRQFGVRDGLKQNLKHVEMARPSFTSGSQVDGSHSEAFASACRSAPTWGSVRLASLPTLPLLVED